MEFFYVTSYGTMSQGAVPINLGIDVCLYKVLSLEREEILAMEGANV